MEFNAQQLQQVEDEWLTLRTLFDEECTRLNATPSSRAEVVDNPDNADAFWVVNPRRDRTKPLLRFGLRRDQPSIICLDEWNGRPRQSFKFVFHGSNVMLTGGIGVVSLPEFVHGRIQGVMAGLRN